MSVTTTRHGATLLLTMENGAVNALSFNYQRAGRSPDRRWTMPIAAPSC
jgi:phage head maturation protease